MQGMVTRIREWSKKPRQQLREPGNLMVSRWSGAGTRAIEASFLDKKQQVAGV